MNTQDLKYKRIVIKVGSNILTAGENELSQEKIADISSQIASLRESGAECVLVSSGAVAAGKFALDIKKTDFETQTRQLCAAVGQARLMHLYNRFFAEHKIIAAQALLSKRDFDDRSGYLNARNTLLACIGAGVVCIVNENDVTSIDELKGERFGDNDTLSALVANMVDADLLLILSDVQGLYDKNPNIHQDACLVERVNKVDDSIKDMAKGRAGTHGTGGMITKVLAAELAAKSGIPTFITKGNEKDAILKACCGTGSGTFFEATHTHTKSKQRFLKSGLSKGTVEVDSGACKALLEKKTSLLPKGIVALTGSFKRGDVVSIKCDGQTLGFGFSNYSADELEQIQGRHSKDIINVLGFNAGDEAIHANNLVII